MSKAVRFHRLGGPEVLQIEDIEVRAPRAGEVRIRVRAFGLNRAEALFRAGSYIEKPELPSGLGLEAAGVIEDVAPDVTELSVGDRVAVIPPISMKQWPVHGELINFPAGFVVRMPDEQSFEDAAATWMACLTAYGALREVAAVVTGEHVVITAASSSVGLAAIQLVNFWGGISVAVTRSARKRDALIAAGARHVIASDDADVTDALRAISHSRGVRVFFDAVGGKLVPQLVSAAAAGGIVINYGALDHDSSNLPPAVLLAKSLTLRGYLVHELVRDPAALARAKECILEGLTSGDLNPTIARIFPIEEIVDAHRFLESNAQFGKVVVSI